MSRTVQVHPKKIRSVVTEMLFHFSFPKAGVLVKKGLLQDVLKVESATEVIGRYRIKTQYLQAFLEKVDIWKSEKIEMWSHMEKKRWTGACESIIRKSDRNKAAGFLLLRYIQFIKGGRIYVYGIF